MGINLKTKLLWDPLTEERAASSERSQANPVPRDTPPRLSRRPSSESPSQPSEDSPEEVESRESQASSTTRPESSSDTSSRTSSRTPSPTPNTPRERPSPPSMSSTPSRDKAEPYTDSEAEQFDHTRVTVYYDVS